MKFKKSAIRSLGASTLAIGSILGMASTANAEPEPAPIHWQSAMTIKAIPANDDCTMRVDFSIETDRERPGHVTFVTTPVQADVRPDGSCDAALIITSGWLVNYEHPVSLTSGPDGGETVRTEIYTGSGPQGMRVVVPAKHPLIPFYREASSGYVFVP